MMQIDLGEAAMEPYDSVFRCSEKAGLTSSDAPLPHLFQSTYLKFHIPIWLSHYHQAWV